MYSIVENGIGVYVNAVIADLSKVSKEVLCYDIFKVTVVL